MEQNFFALTVAGFCLAALAGWFNLPLGLGLGFVLAWMLWKRADNFFEGLRDYAEKVSRRDFDAPMMPRERGYLAEVQMALESMAFDLKSAFETESHGRLQLETALKGIQDGVLVLDKDGRILFANPSLEIFFQAGFAGKQGAYFWEVFREAEVTEVLKAVLSKREGATRDFQVMRESGRHLFLVASPLPGPDGQPSGLLALFYDRTEQKRLEKMRSDFAANVSHELRTPLTAIRAALETLRDGALDDPKVNRSFLDKAANHTERLNELISDLLSLAAIEEDRRLNRVDALTAKTETAGAWQDALGMLEGVISAKEGQVEAALEAGAFVRCDRMALRQIFVNLVENALKYSGPHPRVKVLAQPSGASMEISVEDRGPGIPEEDLQRVFERFYRVDKARVRGNGNGGSGLGLAIVKHLAENYTGQVGVENRPEGGARFWVRLPQA
jgi:two-component system phosphate regulon sensor histidine kinase PhoR